MQGKTRHERTFQPAVNAVARVAICEHTGLPADMQPPCLQATEEDVQLYADGTQFGTLATSSVFPLMINKLNGSTLHTQ